MKKLIYSALFVSLGMVGALASAQPAYAASAYDDTITMTNTLTAKCWSDSTEIDMSLDWSAYFKNAGGTYNGKTVQNNTSSGDRDTFVNAFDTALDNETGWGVSQATTAAGGKEIFVYLSTSNVNFDTYGSVKQAKISSTTNWAIIGCYSNSIVTVNFYNSTQTNRVMASNGISEHGYEFNPYFWNGGAINYPPNYEGVVVPNTAPTPPVQSSHVPDLYVSESTNWIATVHDRNFNTFDGILWTCSEDGNAILDDDSGLAPVLYWQVWRDDFPTEGVNLLIDDGYQSATAPISIELPINRDEAKEYRVAAWYECGGTVEFTDAANKSFVVNAMGVLDESAALNNCISDEFPFVYLDDCIGNLMIFGKIALFGGATFNNNWTASTSCTTLNQMDDWLHLENPTVCPMMPAYVRNIVTPFVTFLLGLITMRFLATRTGKDF